MVRFQPDRHEWKLAVPEEVRSVIENLKIVAARNDQTASRIQWSVRLDLVIPRTSSGRPVNARYYEVKPNGPLYPRGRLIITGGNDFQVLYDGPNFFWHGKFPFVPIRLKPVPWQFHGVSELRTKVPLQDIVNTILAGVLDMIKKAINPALIFPDDAFSDAIKNALDPSMPTSNWVTTRCRRRNRNTPARPRCSLCAEHTAIFSE